MDTPKRTCSIEGCSRPPHARGWCQLHHKRWWAHGSPLWEPPAPLTRCSIDGCTKPHLSRGWCSMHWKRWRKHGDPLWEPPSAEARFWAKVDKREPDECWPWVGRLEADGYARFEAGGMRCPAHRVAYELTIGPIPEALTIDHTCHNADMSCAGGSTCAHRRCCNPAHLEAVSLKINTLRGRGVSALNAAKTHCPRDHPLSGDNLRLNPDGHRVCRTCQATASAEQYRKRKR